jgi:mono/diheme cytochrome c family protein
MNPRICFIVVMAAAGMSMAQGGARTVRDRVYSQEQAAKGKTSYNNQCSTCHEGGGMGPALKGSEFLGSWENKTVRSLYSRILTTMPSDAPGTLSEQEVLDIVAYLISTNGFPAGEKAFEKPDELNDITIVSQQ